MRSDDIDSGRLGELLLAIVVAALVFILCRAAYDVGKADAQRAVQHSLE